MTPVAIIDGARADGVALVATTAGAIRVAGGREAVSRWLPLIQQGKGEIV